MSVPGSEVGTPVWQRLRGRRTDDDGAQGARRRRLKVPSWRRWSNDGPWPRRLMWIALVLLAFGGPLLSQTGRFVADTKTAVWFQPVRYMANSLRVWQSSPYLGNEQHDGILVPMGLAITVLRATGLPLWIVERLWHGLLLLTAGAGMILLTDRFVGKRLTPAQPIAAAAYAFSPYALGYGLHGSAVFVPYALLPLLLLAWMRGLDEPKGWLWAAAVALVFFAMGGGNGAPQVYVLIPLLAYLAWAVLVDRTIRARSALLFAAKAGVLALFLNLWWLVGLTGQGVANDIAFSEQPPVINVTSSLSESLRLLGFWGFYGFDRFGPWYPTAQRYLLSPLLTIGGFALPAAAFAGAWRSRWRMRSLFVLLAALAVVVMGGIYPVHHSTPFGHVLLDAYARLPGTSGLRTTYKFGATLALSLALLAGVGAAAAWRWLRERPRGRRVAPLLAAVMALALIADAYPLWSGSLYPRYRTVAGIPGYWQDAVKRLRPSLGGGRAFFAPGGLFAYYAWGGLVGSVAEANPQLSTVRRPALPIMERYGSDLLAAIEQPYQLGPRVPGATAALLRRLGVHLVVLQNDLNFARSSTARPTDLQVLLQEPGLQLESFFGRSGQNVPGSGSLTPAGRQQAKAERSLPPVQILRVSDPIPVVRAEGGPPLVVSGDAFGLPPSIRVGLVGKDQPILYSGSLDPQQLAALAPDSPQFVVTDSNRRRQWTFAGVRQNFSYTLTADEGGHAVGYNLFGGRPDTQTVTLLRGAVRISASSYGSPFTQEPWRRPAAAFDGDPSTAWTVGTFDPVGQWIRVDFDQPIDLSGLTITPYLGPPGTRGLNEVAVDFSDGSMVTRHVAPGPTTLAFAARTASWMRIRVAGIRPAPFGGPVGISEVSIPELSIAEATRVPTDLLDTAARTKAGRTLLASAPLSYVFDRAGGVTGVPDEERGIDRVFRVPERRAFDLSGVVRLDPRVPDQELDRLIFGNLDVVASSSGRAGNNPAARASLALDRNPATGWTAAGVKGQWIQVRFPAHRIGGMSVLGFTDQKHSVLTAIEVQVMDGAKLVADRRIPVPATGSVHLGFPRRVADTVKVTVLAAGIPAALGGGARPPVGIRELAIPGVSFPARPNPSAALGCYRGPGATLDGTALPVRLGGTIRGLLRGQSLPIATCGGKPLTLTPGDHELVMTGVLQPSVIALGSSGTAPAPNPDQAPAAPTLHVSSTLSGYRVAVSGATNPFYLVIGQNVAPGWHASVGGSSLGPPLVLDGYSAGWRVDRTGSYTITVAYGPQSRQDAAFAASAVALPLVLAVGAVGWRRRRRHAA